MEKKTLKGKFITFEGPEGSGKSTQIKMLANYLKKKGFKVLCVREPGNTEIGEKIRKILLDPRNKEMSKYTEMLLYMAARAQLIKEVITPALKKRWMVLCDRFLDSTRAYQGFGMGADLNLINKLGEFICQGIESDLTILLDVDTKEGLRRAGRFKDRIERRPFSFHERVRRGYFKLARKYPWRIKVVKVEEDKLLTQTKIRKLLTCLLKI